MRVLKVTDTAIDLAAQDVPFLPNNTVLVVNLTAGELILQSSDASGSGYGTLATVPALEIQSVTLDKQYIKVSTAAELFLVGN